MNDIADAHTYCCDVPECQVPVVLSALVRVGKEHWCRSCFDRLSRRPAVDALYNFAFGDPADAFTMPIEQVEVELRDAGVDPEEVERRVRARLAEIGVHLPE